MSDVLTRLKQRLADAESDAARIREAIRILEADSKPEGASKPPRSTTPVSDSPPKAVPLGRLLKRIGDSPGTTTTTIAKQTGGDRSAILTLLKEAEQAGKVRREGQRRATSWYLTDERP